jgi:hypothetical protein
METSSTPSNQHEDLSFDQIGLGKSSDDDCMVLEKHITINLPEHLVTMRRLVQDAECKKQGFAPKEFQMTFKKVHCFFKCKC